MEININEYNELNPVFLQDRINSLLKNKIVEICLTNPGVSADCFSKLYDEMKIKLIEE